jgi:tryptophan synthase alpha chain
MGSMPKNRITQRFKELRRAEKKALIGYLTAGDPDLMTSERNIRCALDNGLDILELGVPFSDPIADGPVIQAASQRALASGATLERVLALVENMRKDYDHPILLFGYANPFLAYGYEKLCRDASGAGVDGMLIVDLAFEEAGEMREIMRQHGLVMISLLAPTTPVERTQSILRDAEGFVYYIMVRGVTGARDRIAPDLESHIAMIKIVTDLPIAAGFGISSGDQARQVAHLVDGVVVGSALIEAAGMKRLGALVKELRAAIDLSSD